MPRRVLVIGAHSADFVWRAGGAVAVATRNGGTAQVIALSYGERGESGELWKEPGQTIERVKEVRHAEAEKAAAALGAEFKALDFGDYPLEVGPERFIEVVDAIREFAPDVLITHTDTDPFNPDHPVAYEVVARARSTAAGAGVASAFDSINDARCAAPWLVAVLLQPDPSHFVRPLDVACVRGLVGRRPASPKSQ